MADTSVAFWEDYYLNFKVPFLAEVVGAFRIKERLEKEYQEHINSLSHWHMDNGLDKKVNMMKALDNVIKRLYY